MPLVNMYEFIFSFFPSRCLLPRPCRRPSSSLRQTSSRLSREPWAPLLTGRFPKLRPRRHQQLPRRCSSLPLPSPPRLASMRCSPTRMRAPHMRARLRAPHHRCSPRCAARPYACAPFTCACLPGLARRSHAEEDRRGEREENEVISK